MKYLKTSQIAEAVGVHPNTIRLYEKYGLLPLVPRGENGYRLYTNRHLEQVQLIRIAFSGEFMEGEIRDKTVDIIKTAANEKLNEALDKAYEYLEYIKIEYAKALDALNMIQKWISGNINTDDIVFRKRREVAKFLNISIDTLRNWERNNLIIIPHDAQNNRVYGPKEITMLKVIRTLRMANYSMMSILRMIKYVEDGNLDSIIAVAFSSHEEDLKSATDRWISTLLKLEKNSIDLIIKLKDMLERNTASTLSEK
ncbi:MAG TPA: MerR family transcriptional regulator [Pseudobacteroides sp.]|uniref:MerR family transcriptional regulator n=1 Tax=Pseudobacteroides sp. TaxID=1968840 RepID=UPI002F935BE6